MKKPETPQDVLRNAVEYIDTLGWHQGTYQKGDDGGPVCALGALQLGAVNEGVTSFNEAEVRMYELSDKGNDDTLNLYEAARDALTEALAKKKDVKPGLLGIPTFNDTKGTTKRSVKALFNAAIKLLDSGKSTYKGIFRSRV